jgi:hypothetical protein
MEFRQDSIAIDLVASLGACTYTLQDLVSEHLLVNFNKLTIKSVLRSPEYLKKLLNKA